MSIIKRWKRKKLDQTAAQAEAVSTAEADITDSGISDVITIENIPTDKSILKSRGAKRAFFIAFCTTITVAGLIIGMLTVDIHGRRMSVNDNTPVIEVVEHDDGSSVMRIHTFAYDESFEVTTLMGFWHKFKEFFCIPD